ncbi:lysosome-associated membrane glycoprotein 3 [Lissotriton helveticus]
MGSPTLWSFILVLSAFLNYKVAGVGQLPEIKVGSSNGATPALLTLPPATSNAPSENKTTTKPAPTTHTTTNVTQAPTTPATTTKITTAHTVKPTTHTTTNSTQTPTSPSNTTVHTTANTTQTTNHPTTNSTQAPTANTTAHTTANTTVPTNHTTVNSTVTPTLPVNITTTIPANHTSTVPTNITTHTTANGTHTTTHVTVIPTPTYSPKPSPPVTGNYSVSVNGADCIMALMGLELEIHAKEDSFFNIVPNQTDYFGSCGLTSSNLNITFHGGFINFNFIKDKKNYFIDRIQAVLPNLSVRQIANQTLMKTELGASYKCNALQRFQLDKDLTVVMVNARIQAFEIKQNNFGTESVCFQDQSSRIALAVGLTVIIIIILGIILYFIYRRKQSSGYQRL